MPDGSKWSVCARYIAEHRARYYTDLDKEAGRESDTMFGDEVTHALNNHDTLMDWAANNMNWFDVSRYATLVKDISNTDFQEGWVNGEKEVIEIDVGE